MQAATAVETPGLPPSPSNFARFGVAAAISARWPPAELPQTAIFSGSTPRRPLLARNQRSEAFTSWMHAGHAASPERRYSVATHV